MRNLLLVVALLALCACASSGTKVDFAQLNEVRKGQTTYEDVIRRFGRPNFASKNLDGTRTAAYADTAGRSDALVLLPLMGTVIAGAGSSVDTVILYFDDRDILADYKTVPGAASRSARPGAAEPTRASSDAGSPARLDLPTPARTDPARKSADRFELPSWLPQQIRDPRSW